MSATGLDPARCQAVLGCHLAEHLALAPASGAIQIVPLVLERSGVPHHPQDLHQVIDGLAVGTELPSPLAIARLQLTDVNPEQLARAAQLACKVAALGDRRAELGAGLRGAGPFRSQRLTVSSGVAKHPLGDSPDSSCTGGIRQRGALIFL